MTPTRIITSSFSYFYFFAVYFGDQVVLVARLQNFDYLMSHQNYKNSQDAHADRTGYGQNVDKAVNILQVKNCRRNDHQKPGGKAMNFIIVSEHTLHIHRQSDEGR